MTCVTNKQHPNAMAKKPGDKELSPSKRGMVVQQQKDGAKLADIARDHHCAVSTVVYTVERDKKHGTRKSLPGRGRKSIFSSRDKRRVLRDIDQNRKDDWNAVAERFPEFNGAQIGRMANAEGVHRCVAVRKPFIDGRTCKLRML